MKIIHFSDPHAGGPAEDWMAYIDKRWVGVFNYRFRRRFQHDLSKLQKAVDRIMELKPDLAVCTGDLTSSGQPGEFAKVHEIMKPLADSSIPLVYTPGNHDCYVRRTSCVKAVNEAFYEYNQHRFRFDELPQRIELGGAELLIFNTSRPSNLLCSWGFVAPRDAKQIAEWCAEPPAGPPRILITHYPINEPHQIWRVRHRLFFQGKIKKLIAEKRIDLVLCGHVHKPFRLIDELGRGQNVAGSVTRNGSMTGITFDPAERRFTYQQIEL